MCNKNENYRDYLNELVNAYFSNGESLRHTSCIASKYRVTRVPNELFYSLGLNTMKDGVSLQLATDVREAVLANERARKKEGKKEPKSEAEATIVEPNTDTPTFLKATRGMDYVRTWFVGEKLYIAFCDRGRDYRTLITASASENKVVEIAKTCGRAPADSELYSMSFIEYKNLLCMIRDYHFSTMKEFKELYAKAYLEKEEFIDKCNALKEELKAAYTRIENLNTEIENNWWNKLKKFFKS